MGSKLKFRDFGHRNISAKKKTPNQAYLTYMWLSLALQNVPQKLQKICTHDSAFAGPGTWTCLTTFYPKWRRRNALPLLFGLRKAPANRMAERWIFLAFQWIKWGFSYFNYTVVYLKFIENSCFKLVNSDDQALSSNNFNFLNLPIFYKRETGNWKNVLYLKPRSLLLLFLF